MCWGVLLLMRWLLRPPLHHPSCLRALKVPNDVLCPSPCPWKCFTQLWSMDCYLRHSCLSPLTLYTLSPCGCVFYAPQRGMEGFTPPRGGEKVLRHFWEVYSHGLWTTKLSTPLKLLFTPNVKCCLIWEDSRALWGVSFLLVEWVGALWGNGIGPISHFYK